MEENKTYLKTDAVAEILNVHRETVLRYVREGRLNAVPDHPTFPLRRHKLFDEEDVLSFKAAQDIKGYTVPQMAERLQISTTKVHRLIKDGELMATKEPFKAHGRYIIDKESANRYIESKGTTQSMPSSYYNLKQQTYMYQPFIQTGTNQLIRVMDIDNQETLFQTKDQHTLPFNEATALHYKPLQPLVKKTYIQKKGDVRFQFHHPLSLNDRVYDVIDWLMSEVGYLNLDIQSDNGSILLSVKECTLETNQSYEFITYLQKHCIDGDVQMNDGFIAFISNEQYTALLLHQEIKSELKAMAKERNGSISDVIEELVKKERNISKSNLSKG